MSRFRALLLLVFVACSAWGSEPAPNLPGSAASSAQEAPLPEDEIFWRTDDDGSKVAIFVSERILNTRSWDSLGMRPFAREMLERRASASDAPKFDPFGRPYPECAYDFHTGVGEPHWRAVPFSEFIGDQRVAVVGRVRQVIPGWNSSYAYVSSMVEVRVSEVFRQKDGWPREGDLIFYEQKRGSITVKGRKFCFEAEPGEETLRAEIGQSLFLVGNHLDDWDPRFLYGSAAWPVAGEEIVPQPYTGLSERRPVKLAEIRQILQSGKP